MTTDRRIPTTETLELLMSLEPDSVAQLRLEQASRDELFQHMRNLAEVVVGGMVGVDTRQVRAVLNAAWLRGPATDGWEQLGDTDVIA